MHVWKLAPWSQHFLSLKDWDYVIGPEKTTLLHVSHPKQKLSCSVHTESAPPPSNWVWIIDTPQKLTTAVKPPWVIVHFYWVISVFKTWGLAPDWERVQSWSECVALLSRPCRWLRVLDYTMDPGNSSCEQIILCRFEKKLQQPPKLFSSGQHWAHGGRGVAFRDIEGFRIFLLLILNLICGHELECSWMGTCPHYFPQTFGGGFSFPYIEKIEISWCDRGITQHQLHGLFVTQV